MHGRALRYPQPTDLSTDPDDGLETSTGRAYGERMARSGLDSSGLLLPRRRTLVRCALVAALLLLALGALYAAPEPAPCVPDVPAAPFVAVPPATTAHGSKLPVSAEFRIVGPGS